jgi:hypothetical protein
MVEEVDEEHKIIIFTEISPRFQTSHLQDAAFALETLLMIDAADVPSRRIESPAISNRPPSQETGS